MDPKTQVSQSTETVSQGPSQPAQPLNPQPLKATPGGQPVPAGTAAAQSQTPPPTQQSTFSAPPEPHVGNPLKKVLLAFFYILILGGLAGGSYYLGTQNELAKLPGMTTPKLVAKVTITQTPTPTPTPTPNPVATWSAYIGNDFTFKYPATWTVKKNPLAPYDVYAYDPATTLPAGSGATSYKDTIDVTPITSSQTPQAYIAGIQAKQTSAALANDFKTKTVVIGTQQVMVYYEGGEGVAGWYIPFSNGKEIISFGPIATDPSLDSIESQIVKTFSFTQ